MAELNWTSQTDWSNTDGVEAALTYAATAQHPSVTIPLFITEFQLPVRGQKFQDLSTRGSQISGYQADSKAIFFGTQEPLQTSFSGFTHTPMRPRSGLATPVFDPIAAVFPDQVLPQFATPIENPFTAVPATEPSLDIMHVTYPELILAYMEGRMHRTAQGAFERRDPSQFRDPYGNVYSNPIVMTFEAAFTTTAKKQTFSMTLRLAG